MVIIMNNSAMRGFLKASVILGFIFVILYIVSYNKWLNNNFDDIDITYGGEKNKEKEIVKVDYKDLYEKINYEFMEYNLGSEFFDIYYGNEKPIDEYYLFVGITNLIRTEMLVNCNIAKEIDQKDVDSKINELFGNVSYTNKSFKNIDGSLSFEYDELYQKYLVKTNKCSGFDYKNGGIKNIYIDSYIDGKFLYIREKSIFLDYTNDSFGNIIFNYHEGLDKNSKIISNSFDKIDLETVSTYTYKFMDNSGNYTLVSIGK